MHGVSLVSVVCVSLCLFGVGGCGVVRPAAVNSSEPVGQEESPLSPASLAVGATFSARVPEVARTRGNVPATQSHGVDSYLAWLAAFDNERQRHAPVWKKALPDAENLAAGMTTGGDVTEEQVRIAAQLAREFDSQSLPPAECQTLADLYGASLTKSAAALRCVRQVGEAGQEKDENGLPFLAACADTGEADMIKADTELRWIREQFPRSKAKQFSLTF